MSFAEKSKRTGKAHIQWEEAKQITDAVECHQIRSLNICSVLFARTYWRVLVPGNLDAGFGGGQLEKCQKVTRWLPILPNPQAMAAQVLPVNAVGSGRAVARWQGRVGATKARR
jgi:hypothetical protein